MLWFGLGIGLQVGIPIGAVVTLAALGRLRRGPHTPQQQEGSHRC